MYVLIKYGLFVYIIYQSFSGNKDTLQISIFAIDTWASCAYLLMALESVYYRISGYECESKRLRITGLNKHCG